MTRQGAMFLNGKRVVILDIRKKYFYPECGKPLEQIVQRRN